MASKITNWYWRDGSAAINPRLKIGSKAWHKAYRALEKKLTDYDYKVVRVSHLWWGGRLSTVWLGLDHSFDLHPKHTPIIFETMLFPPKFMRSWFGEDMDRYATEEQAIKGHWRMYREWSNPFTMLKYAFYELEWKIKLWRSKHVAPRRN